MVAKWRTLALPALLALTLAAGPVTTARAGGEGTKNKDVKEQLERLDASLKKSFERVAEEMRALKSDLQDAKEERASVQKKLQDALTRITSLDRTVSDLKRELEGVKQRPAPEVTAGTPSDRYLLEDVRNRLTRIEKMLDRPLVPGRVAMYPPSTGESGEGRRERMRDVRDELERIDAAAQRGFDRLRDELNSVRREVKECRADRTLAELKLQTALAQLGTLQPQLADLRAELERARARAPDRVALYPPAEQAALDDIRARLSQIEQTLLRTPAPAQTSVAQYPPPGGGRLLLVNRYPEELTFVVDGRRYAVAPGGTMTVEGQPAGSLTYEVVSPTWGVRDRRTTTVAAGETVTLTAR